MHDDDLPVGRVYSRKEALALLGGAGVSLFAGVVGAGCGSGGSDGASVTPVVTVSPSPWVSPSPVASPSASPGVAVATPELTEGPFFVDEGLNRSNLLGDTTRASVINGAPFALAVNVYMLSGATVAAFAGAQVDVWHTDAVGAYSDEAGGGIQSEDTTGQKFLRGYQVTDASGAVNFQTIYPGWYQGRAVHIHFKVRKAASGSQTYEFTSQFFFDDTLSDTVLAQAPYNTRGTRTVRNANDGIYNEGGSRLVLNVSKSGSGYAATHNIYLAM